MDQLLHIRASCVIDQHSIYKNRQLLFGDSNAIDAVDFLTEAYRHFNINYPRFYKMDNLCKLGWLCSELLISNNLPETEAAINNNLKELPPESVCLMLCNASSSLDTDHKYFETVSKMASPALFVYTLPNIVMGEICIRNGWKGENTFFILESFNADFLAQQVEDAMNDTQNQACICGWVELLGHEFKAALFLVQCGNDGQNLSFTAENISDIFESA